MEGPQENAEDELILSSLPREMGWAIPDLYLFQQFWCPSILIKEVNIFQKQFEAKDSDIFVASFPKSGTTWLKAITFAIVNRQCFSSIHNHPLLTSNPHQLVPAVEFMYRGDIHCPTTEPRVFGTHTPFPSLPNSIIESKCKIIYICRNPFDIFVSAWTFFDKIKLEPLSTLKIEEAFEKYCNGIIEFGPWWSHMVGYWKESLAKPNKVLFLKYEDLKDDANFQVKKIADFLGFPFTQEEENNQVIESIIKLCSFEKMKNSEVNKSGIIYQFLEKKYFFRKGETRDWVNYFSPSMTEKLCKIIEEKFGGSGLSFMI
ncbi:cytosolic sulfotransferase 15-like [Vigna unguiculata]|uniref:cytosolic sulfotransferase 15-like n=1 Tax=Vigna unguiculata TaxID=3917 RepID=UPI0010170B95|nr:cytosolic sulfotransferase 15-like [Vigna unguiculata]